MSLKFVYALISGNGDCYTEQTLVSIYTLRRHNPEAHIALVTDNDTIASLTGNRAQIKEYADEIIAVNLPTELSPVQRSRYIKTSLRQNVDGDFLYIDNDTIVIAPLDDLEKSDCEMAAVLDLHSTDNNSRKLKEYMEITHNDSLTKVMDGEGDIRYFNGGVLFVRDTEATHRLYADWHRIWNEERVKYGVDIDQPSFAQANIANDCLIKEMDGRYNCQISTPNAKRHLVSARIIHYFHSSQNEQFYIYEVLKRIKMEGLTAELQKIIDSPDFFLSGWSMLDDTERRVYELPMSVLGRKLARDYPWSNKIAKFVYRLFGFEI